MGEGIGYSVHRPNALNRTVRETHAPLSVHIHMHEVCSISVYGAHRASLCTFLPHVMDRLPRHLWWATKSH